MATLLNLVNKQVLITGGCGAIGQAVVRSLSDHGATVYVNDILPQEQAQRIFTELPAVHYLPADISTADGVAQLLAALGNVIPDIVCCHAGHTFASPLDSYPLAEFDAVFGLNVRAAHLVAQAAVQEWLKRNVKGQLIFTSSWVQDVPWPDITAYNASKAALKALMRGYAREYAAQGIRANAIAPGIVAVGMAKKQWDTDPDYQKRAARAIPLGYLQPVESVANAFLFLCSDLSSYMTGTTLLIDGGASLYPMDEV